jgi:hypothetical protein
MLLAVMCCCKRCDARVVWLRVCCLRCATAVAWLRRCRDDVDCVVVALSVTVLVVCAMCCVRDGDDDDATMADGRP